MTTNSPPRSPSPGSPTPSETGVTGWKCDMCKAEGELTHPMDADAYGMLGKIGKAHKRASPACRYGEEWVRVWTISRVPLRSGGEA